MNFKNLSISGLTAAVLIKLLSLDIDVKNVTLGALILLGLKRLGFIDTLTSTLSDVADKTADSLSSVKDKIETKLKELEDKVND